MRCWPLDVIRTSALLPAHCAWELRIVHETRHLSQMAINACWHVARRTEPVEMTGLVMVKSDDDLAPKFTYLREPPFEQWKRLDRIVIVDAFHGGLEIVMSTSH